MFRNTVLRTAAIARTARPFSTSPLVRKDAVDTVKDAAKKVDRTVSDQLVAGINKGSEVASSVKGSLDSESGSAKGKAKELTGEAEKNANSAAGQAKGAAHEAAGKVKGKVEEAKGKLS